MTEEMDEIMAPTPEDNLDSNDADVNTALTPSSSDTPVCKRFLRRRCTFGATCKFLHPGAEELLDELLTRTKPEAKPQSGRRCRFLIHGQRRCKNSAVVDANHCSCHADGANLGGANVSATAPAARIRISASHKRMTNPESVVEAPAPVCMTTAAATDGAGIDSVMVDIGCARGHWVLRVAPKVGARTLCLGLELRGELVEAANEAAEAGGLGNAQFRTMNCKNERHWEALGLTDLPQSTKKGRSCLLCIQFPDPWAKARHRRRRVVDPEVVDMLLRRFAGNFHTDSEDDGSEELFIYLCSDREDLFYSMRSEFLHGVRRFDGSGVDGGKGGAEGRSDSGEKGDGCGENESGDADGDGDRGDGQSCSGDGIDVEDFIENNDAVEFVSSDSSSAPGIPFEGFRTTFEPLSLPLFGLGTERDHVCELKHRPVWRCLIRRRRAGKETGRDNLQLCLEDNLPF